MEYVSLNVSFADKEMVKLLGGQWIDGRWVVKRTNTNFRNNLFDRWLGDVDKIWLDGTYKDNAEVF